MARTMRVGDTAADLPTRRRAGAPGAPHVLRLKRRAQGRAFREVHHAWKALLQGALARESGGANDCIARKGESAIDHALMSALRITGAHSSSSSRMRRSNS